MEIDNTDIDFLKDAEEGDELDMEDLNLFGVALTDVDLKDIRTGK